jgi:hypothetical protein
MTPAYGKEGFVSLAGRASIAWVSLGLDHRQVAGSRTLV